MAEAIVGATTKVCKKCGEEKAIEEFQFCVDKNASHRRGKCKDCWRVDQKLALRKYRKEKGHLIQARHRVRLATDPEYRERKRNQDIRKYQRSKEYKQAWQTKYRRENREKVRLCDRNKRLQKEYGITLVDFRRMLTEQNNRCLICNEQFKKESQTHVDHCHKTGIVRGLLCPLCNVGLGSFRDRPELLLEAANYLNTRSSKVKEAI